MAESSRRKVGRIEEDRISQLPLNVQETLLCSLPIRDAVRTSVLSKKWRHCWTMMPHLIFDNDFVHRVMDKLDQRGGDELMAYKFVSVINRTVLLHKGPIINFSLTIPQSQCNAQIIHDFVDQWISLLSCKGIKQLTIKSSGLLEVKPHDFYSLDLTHLTLFKVRFPCTSAYGRFTSLTNLYLLKATSNLGQSILDCPVLEKLTLIICTGLFHTNFHAPNLKCLRQVYFGTDFEISCAGLENLTEYSFTLLMLGTLMETKTSNMVKVLGSLHRIEKFSIAMKFMKYLAEGGCPNRLSKPLPYLKTLNISGINFTHLSEVSCLLCMIWSAPNLCKLYISAEVRYEEKGLKNYRIEDSEDCTTINHLETVTFSYFKGLKAELELVKFVLAHSPLLKTMFIHRDKRIKNDAALTMTEEILQYPRASTIAQIRHLKCCVEIGDFDKELWVGYDILS
ncbi:FBD domain-containing protein [Heracleum sosnowskyi]|uniref:FBD domain-containing protein n=1 Tax=Heracleum sosnowskyi TaxID=360622 RepID=A0AAD8GUJ2_9APIA|nr:FBD domain-containing protein [Heracleum sosnowskyi]